MGVGESEHVIDDGGLAGRYVEDSVVVLLGALKPKGGDSPEVREGGRDDSSGETVGGDESVLGVGEDGGVYAGQGVLIGENASPSVELGVTGGSGGFHLAISQHYLEGVGRVEDGDVVISRVSGSVGIGGVNIGTTLTGKTDG